MRSSRPQAWLAASVPLLWRSESMTLRHPGIDGQAWARSVDRAVAAVIDTHRDLDPPCDEPVRRSDGRSVSMDPAKAHLTDARILEQEERILDIVQADAATAVAGDDRPILVVGPAGTGKKPWPRA